jgi:hypothetical protein
MTSHAALDPDPPCCPACDYSLIGLTSPTRCPECGQWLEKDFSTYRRVRTPWSAGRQPVHFLAGLVKAILHPLRTAALCAESFKVTRGSAILFAAISTLLTIAGWPVIKITAMFAISGLLGDRLGTGWLEWFRFEYGDLLNGFRWRTYCGWEAWSIARWWLLLGILAAALHRREPAMQEGYIWFRRLLLFAPWITILEIAHLAGVLIAHPMIVPEPNTLFASDLDTFRLVWTNRFWLWRAVIPTFLIGLVFARAVLDRRWSFSFIFAVVLVPPGMAVSVAWTLLFIHGGILDVLYQK